MKTSDLKIGDKVKFRKGAAIVSGFINYIYPSGKFLTDDAAVWGSDIIAKIEEKEIPIDKPIKYTFEFDVTESLIDYVWKAGRHVPVGYIGGATEGWESVRLPLGGNITALFGKKFKVTVEEVE